MKYLAGVIALALLFLRLPEHFSSDIIARDQTIDLPNAGHVELSSNTYRYLGNGKQSIAFANDNQVIKFFLTQKFHPRLKLKPFWVKPRVRVRRDILTRYAIAYQKIPFETALIATHLNATKGTLPHITLIGPHGEQASVDLNRCAFVLQKRATPITGCSPDQIKRLLNTIASRGFHNLGERFNDENFAQINGEPVMIDVGNLAYCSAIAANPAHEIDQMDEKLHRYLTN